MWLIQVAEALLDLIARHGCWRIAMSLLSFCSQSLAIPQRRTALQLEVLAALQQAEAAADFTALPLVKAGTSKPGTSMHATSSACNHQ